MRVRRKTQRVANARQLVVDWFETNVGTAAQAHRATKVGRSTVDLAIAHMRALGLPQVRNVIAKTRGPNRNAKIVVELEDDDERGFRVPTTNIVETALLRRLPLEQAWCEGIAA